MTDGFETIGKWIGLVDTPPPPPQAVMSQLEDGTDRPGNDFKDIGVASFDECQNTCLADAKCEAVSYNVSAKQCWMKNGQPLRVERVGFQSAVKHMQ